MPPPAAATDSHFGDRDLGVVEVQVVRRVEAVPAQVHLRLGADRALPRHPVVAGLRPEAEVGEDVLVHRGRPQLGRVHLPEDGVDRHRGAPRYRSARALEGDDDALQLGERVERLVAEIAAEPRVARRRRRRAPGRRRCRC